MIKVSDIIFEFADLYELNTYSAKKYGKNSVYFDSKIFSESKSLHNKGIRCFTIAFNKTETIELGVGLNYYISIADIKQKPGEACAVLGALNAKRANIGELHCYADGRHVFLTSPKYISSIELAIAFIDKEMCPDYMNILYNISAEYQL